MTQWIFSRAFAFIPFCQRLSLRLICSEWNQTVANLQVSAVAVIVLEVPTLPTGTPALTFDDLFKDSPTIDDEKLQSCVVLRSCSLVSRGFPFEPVFTVQGDHDVLLRTTVSIKCSMKNLKNFKENLASLFTLFSGCVLGRVVCVGDASKPTNWNNHFPTLDHLESTIVEIFNELDVSRFWIEYNYSEPIVAPLAEKVTFRFLNQELCLWGPITLRTPNLTFLEIESDEMRLADQGPDSLLANLSKLEHLSALIIRGMSSIYSTEMNYLAECRSLKHLCIDGPLRNDQQDTTSFLQMMEALQLKSFGISWSPVVYTAVSEWIVTIRGSTRIQRSFQKVEMCYIDVPGCERESVVEYANFFLDRLKGIRSLFVDVSVDVVEDLEAVAVGVESCRARIVDAVVAGGRGNAVEIKCRCVK
ncbi:UNVERIFIED_CONTAM: hypothetical protein HDU68_011528 [Siphonaria sp. JEL0065]|nr:hypothetical protein HDU68_011528 [Siphonaria sp. JEL0065]